MDTQISNQILCLFLNYLQMHIDKRNIKFYSIFETSLKCKKCKIKLTASYTYIGIQKL